MPFCNICGTNHRLLAKEKEFKKHEDEALDILRKALERAQRCFEMEEHERGRLAMAKYCFGYLGVRFDLTV